MATMTDDDIAKLNESGVLMTCLKPKQLVWACVYLGDQEKRRNFTGQNARQDAREWVEKTRVKYLALA